MSEIPALALPPPPTTNTRTDVTPTGTVHSQVPTLVNVRTVSPPTIVDVGTQSAAFAGTGIETNNPEINAVVRNEAIFGRKDLPFMRANPKITFTSLFRAIAREA
jgi:hypothetical protein